MTRLVPAAVVSMLVISSASGPAHATPPIETLASFDPTLGQIPEAVTTDHRGNLYFSWASTSTIQKRAPDGTISTFGTLPIAVFTLGVKVGPDGCVYTVSTSLSALAGAFVWRICTPGVVEQVATLDAAGGPNDLAFDDDGRLYVTDPFLGQIWQIDRRGDHFEPRVWLADPRFAGNAADPALVFHSVGVDGIAFDDEKRNLYVDNLDYGTILRIGVRDGRPRDVSVFASDPRLRGADGIAFDDRGTLFVAVNAQDSLVSIDRRGAITVLDTGGPLDGPSSIVFGATGRDAHEMYLTSSAFSRAFGFEAGTPHPALLGLRVEHGGLPLP